MSAWCPVCGDYWDRAHDELGECPYREDIDYGDTDEGSI